LCGFVRSQTDLRLEIEELQDSLEQDERALGLVDSGSKADSTRSPKTPARSLGTNGYDNLQILPDSEAGLVAPQKALEFGSSPARPATEEPDIEIPASALAALADARDAADGSPLPSSAGASGAPGHQRRKSLSSRLKAIKNKYKTLPSKGEDSMAAVVAAAQAQAAAGDGKTEAKSTPADAVREALAEVKQGAVSTTGMSYEQLDRRCKELQEQVNLVQSKPAEVWFLGGRRDSFLISRRVPLQ
jgi:hypothetical protein